ncbi:MAG: GPW/gp25 family protein [Kineosporiaceae bacterium]
MSAPVRRGWTGWRFGHPDLDAPDDGGPGLGVAATGAIATVTDADAVRQSLLLLLSTRPGERIMRPTYGCELHKLVFAPNDDTTAGLAIHYVRRAVERFEPRAVVVRVDAGPAPGRPDLLEVVLEYRPRLGGPLDSVTVALALQEGF